MTTHPPPAGQTVFVYWLSFANPAAVSAEVAQCAAWMSDLPVGVTHLTTALTTITATSVDHLSSGAALRLWIGACFSLAHGGKPQVVGFCCERAKSTAEAQRAQRRAVYTLTNTGTESPNQGHHLAGRLCFVERNANFGDCGQWIDNGFKKI